MELDLMLKKEKPVMKCPRDNSPLEREVFCGVEIDSCSQCNGTWLDGGEMSKVAGISGDPAGDVSVPDGELTDREPGFVMGCPRCEKIALKPRYYSSKDKIIIDMCPNCRGFWIDGGELRLILKAIYKEYGM